MRPILERLKKTGDIDKRHGARVRYANPINGGPVLPTMGANLALLPKGFKGEPYRSTDGTIFAVRRRQGHDQSSTASRSNGASTTSSWCRRGSTIRTRAGEEAVLFSISDRPAQEALGIWREGKLSALRLGLTAAPPRGAAACLAVASLQRS